ncbi:MAG: GatB/YqeY domain-containing protein [Bacilli bacterium]|nr:GatB/YqeY domain-containing protein [Bacilli bacterium]
MYENIKNDITKYMKEKDMSKVQTLRGIKGDVDLEHINKKIEITDNLVIDMLSRGIKTRRESIVEFEKGNREDLIGKTNAEIEFLSTYLPKQLTRDELMEIVEEAFNKVNPTSAKDMGLIMKEITPLVKGKCDMKELSSIIKERLETL